MQRIINILNQSMKFLKSIKAKSKILEHEVDVEFSTTGKYSFNVNVVGKDYEITIKEL